MIPHPTCIDVETYGIDGRPDYPPKPVGVAIKQWRKHSRYYAFGHPSGNNCTFSEAQAAIAAAYTSGPILMHNAKFDLDVIEVHFKIAPPPWDAVHDTVFALFLDDPHTRSVALKSAAERLLGLKPEERDVVADWLVANQPVKGVKISRAAGSKHAFGRYIAYAPGNIVGPYARGDVDRTEALFRHLYPRLVERDMLAAYDRERRLVPILLDMERRGIRVDVKRLRADVATYNEVLERCSAYARRRLRAKQVNLDSGGQLVAALEAAGMVDVAALGITPTGKAKTDKKALAAGVTDKPLAAVLRYRTQLQTCLRTFMEPWLATAERSRGFVYTHWNQTRGEGGGARTGRLSSSPNFQNIPNTFDEIKLPISLPPLPLCRGYLIPYVGQVLCGRDFASQELRVLAHFEDGAMRQSYVDNPTVDFHQLAADMITQMTGVNVTRKAAKAIGFSILYGAGQAKLASQLGCPVEDVKQLLDAYFQVFPGVRELQEGLKFRAAFGQPIRTAGGREYYVEPPREIDGKVRTFAYKLLNYLVQGSSADQTKDAMIRFYDAAGPGKLLASVHDEILISTRHRAKDMALLKAAMNDAGLDVPMLSDGEVGMNWASMEATRG